MPFDKAGIIRDLTFSDDLPDGAIYSGTEPFRITYAFQNAAPAEGWKDFYGPWQAPSLAERAAIRAGMEHIEQFVNVRFVDVTGSSGDPILDIGIVSLPDMQIGSGGLQAPYPGGTAGYQSHVVFERDWDITRDPWVILHELGHSLGLDHPFDHDGTSKIPGALDNNDFTVMSYNESPRTGEPADTLMLLDVFALQYLWGANMTHALGNQTYGRAADGERYVVWDAGGNDAISASGLRGDAVLDLREGKFSSFGGTADLGIAIGAVIERAIGGAGDDRIIGNGSANVLHGNAGSDRMFGLGGADRLMGGGGSDVLRGGGGGDLLGGGSGRDALFGAAGKDRLFGGGGNDRMSGGGGRDQLFGGAGNDLMRGDGMSDRLLGGKGNDTLVGGDGADRLFGNQGADRLVGGGGRDVLQGQLGADRVHGGAHDDRLLLGSGADRGWGNAGDDLLLGQGGNDRLFGGSGRDRLDGGAGDDVLRGGGGADVFVFGTGGGRDRIRDFQEGIDRLDFGGADFALGVANGNAVLDFGGGDRLIVEGQFASLDLAAIAVNDALLVA